MRYPYNILPNPNLSRAYGFRGVYQEEDTDANQYHRYLKSSTLDRTYSFTLHLSQVQFSVWCSFVLRDLDQGSEWFEMLVPDDTGTFRLADARLVEGTFTASHDGPDRYTVTAMVDLEQGGVYTAFSDTFLKLDNTTTGWFDVA